MFKKLKEDTVFFELLWVIIITVGALILCGTITAGLWQ